MSMPQNSKAKPDLEVLSYCFSAVVSMVNRVVLRSQQKDVYQLVEGLLMAPEASETSAKYGVQVLQFLLHTKT